MLRAGGGEGGRTARPDIRAGRPGCKSNPRPGKAGEPGEPAGRVPAPGAWR